MIYLESIPRNVEELLQGMEFKENGEDKDKTHIEKLIRKSLKVKGAHDLKQFRLYVKRRNSAGK